MQQHMQRTPTTAVNGRHVIRARAFPIDHSVQQRPPTVLIFDSRDWHKIYTHCDTVRRRLRAFVPVQIDLSRAGKVYTVFQKTSPSFIRF